METFIPLTILRLRAWNAAVAGAYRDQRIADLEERCLLHSPVWSMSHVDAQAYTQRMDQDS